MTSYKNIYKLLIEEIMTKLNLMISGLKKHHHFWFQQLLFVLACSCLVYSSPLKTPWIQLPVLSWKKILSQQCTKHVYPMIPSSFVSAYSALVYSSPQKNAWLFIYIPETGFFLYNVCNCMKHILSSLFLLNYLILNYAYPQTKPWMIYHRGLRVRVRVCVFVSECLFVCVYACVKERERERERESVCVCFWVRDRERERERDEILSPPSCEMNPFPHCIAHSIQSSFLLNSRILAMRISAFKVLRKNHGFPTLPFIVLAERKNLIEDYYFWVLHRTCYSIIIPAKTEILID